jgi:hypothetical protein
MTSSLTTKYYLLSINLLLSLFTELSVAGGKPAMPFIERGVCPFECCQFGYWHTKSLLRVYQAEGDTSNLAYTIAVNDSFLAITGNVHMDKLGIVIVTKSVESFKPGDTLYTLSYRGEGFIDVWQDSTIHTIEIFWDSRDEADVNKVNAKDPRWNESSGVLVSRPSMVWWVEVQNRKGQTGWIRLVNTTIQGFSTDEQIDGDDACG